MPSRKTVSIAVLMFAALVLAACSSGPPRRIYAPTASIQQLTVQADGQWLLQVRVQSFSNVPHTVTSLDAVLRIDGIEAASVRVTPAVAIGPQSAEIEELHINPGAEAATRVNAALETGRRVDYHLSGTLVSSDPQKRTDTFTFDGQLWPAPGLAGVLR